MTTPTLSLCMIVKNEAALLPRCLESVQGLVDEIIIVDTGSTDATIAIARAAGARVETFVWCDDFSAARNASLAYARCDWILVLDADEVLARADHAAIRSALARDDLACASLVQTTYTSRSSLFGWQPNRLVEPEAAGQVGYFEARLTRLFRRSVGIQFTGKIHEHAECGAQAVTVEPLPLRIHHYGGYTDTAVNDRKGALYLRLSEDKCREHPESGHAWYELGVQYWMMARGAEARNALERAVALVPHHELAHWALGCLAQSEGRWADALTALLRVLELDPNNMGAYALLPLALEQLGEMGLAERVLDELQPAALVSPAFCVNASNVYLAMGNPRKALRVLAAVGDGAEVGAVALNQAQCYCRLGDVAAATVAFQRAMAHPEVRVAALQAQVEWALARDELSAAQQLVAQLLDEAATLPRAHFLDVVVALRLKNVAHAKQRLAQFSDDAALAAADRSAMHQIRCLLHVPVQGMPEGGVHENVTTGR